MSFLPDGYQEPQSANDKYLKLKQGENRFRVLGPAIVGAVGWTEVNGKKKPIRKRSGEAFKMGEVDETTLKHFWAFPIWNYEKNRVQVAEFTQAGIRKAIKSYVAKPSWGDPTQYDIIVTREGEGLETEYHITPEPKSPLPSEAAEAWERMKTKFDINRLFDGGDPFEPSSSTNEIDVDNIPF